jgi:YD repeat-containing protein
MKKISIITVLLLNVIFAFSQTTYQYDNLNRLTQVNYSNGTSVVYTYDELGNRTKKTVSTSPSGIEDIDVSAVAIYPNPAKDIVILKGASGKTVTVYSSTGSIIFEKNNVDAEETISTSSWASGIYLVKITDDGKSEVVKKLIKE